MLGVCTALAILAGPAAAGARPATAAKDGRPNILVIMTDDQSRADVAKMPNVRRLLAAKGTTFANAVDSFPLCCPSRATFITGQYAHNHGVIGNFYPYGWYGMKLRGNILPAWLQRAGYDTALIGKWLNGYGALDAHGEVPKGFDIWRGLLDVSAYDYFNFVMNRDGKLKSWGDAAFARKLVKFANIEVTPNPRGLAGVIAKLNELFGPAPYKYWGAQRSKDYSPDVTGKIAEDLVGAERTSKKPFFIWWSPAAPHREDVSTTLMGRPGRDPRPAPRYAKKSSAFTLPEPASFNEADFSDKPSNMRDHAPVMNPTQIHQLQLDYQGRIGSLLAVDDHVKQLVKVRQRLAPGSAPHHRRQVPALRGIRGGAVHSARARRAGEQDGAGSGVQHRLRPDARRRRTRQRRPQAGRRLTHAHRPQPPAGSQPSHRTRGTGAALRPERPDQRMGPALQGRAHGPLHLRGLQGDR